MAQVAMTTFTEPMMVHATDLDPLRQNILDLNNQVAAGSNYSCTLYQGTAQSLTNNVNAAISFDSVIDDPHLMWGNISNPTRLVAPFTAMWKVQTVVAFASHADSNGRQVSIRVNGATYVPASATMVPAVNGAITTCVSSPLVNVFLHAGDYVEAMAVQVSGVSLNTAVGLPNQSGIVMFMQHT